ncbi:hypothetical protein, partial [Kribbia dieselivorans]|uniref:hypothetical protein n=1 Tax=Kribbia dieselivorans TaxID=331526 RepID=UPI00083986A5
LGRRAAAAATTWSRVVPALLVLATLPLVGAVLRQQHCLRYGWNGDEQFWRQCFSDLPSQYQIGGLSVGLPGWMGGSAPLDQPPLTAAALATLGGFVPAGDDVSQTRWFVIYWIVLITVLLLTTVWLTAATRPGRLDLAAQVALSPIIVLTALLSSDALAVALVAAAMYAWHRQSWVWTGVLLGLGVLTREYVIAVVVALLISAVRRRLVVDAMAAIGIVVTLVAMLVVAAEAIQPSLLTASWAQWWSGVAGYGSIWFVPAAMGSPLPVWAVRLAAIGAWLVAIAVGAAFAARAQQAPTFAQTAAVIVLIGAALSPVLPVQAALWVLPLIALAGVTWRDHLIWAAVEAVHFVIIWIYIAGMNTPERGIPGQWYAWLLVARFVMWVALAGVVMWRAETEAGGADADRAVVHSRDYSMSEPAVRLP